MTTAFEQDRAPRRNEGTAANDDHVGQAGALNHLRANSSSAETGGWDAYEVWRRLIKEARDRRAGSSFPS
jgi:hypothetical protein